MVLTPPLVVHLPPAVAQAAIRGVHIANAARYLSASGLVALLYDHFLALGDEVKLIWTAPRSFLKWFFLINHYLVELCLIEAVNEMSGFNGLLNDDRTFATAIACYSMMSNFAANFLWFMRVIDLWYKSPRVMLGLGIALAMTFLAVVACTVSFVVVLRPAVRYDPILNLCYLAKSTKPSIILWAAPLAFDITVLAFMIYNSLSNPRDFKISLRRTLYRDGILFFVVITLVRVLNIVFYIVTEPALATLPAYFSWAVITLACRRLLIHIRSCEQELEAAYYKDSYTPRNNLTETNSEFAIELRSHEG